VAEQLSEFEALKEEVSRKVACSTSVIALYVKTVLYLVITLLVCWEQ
jgi:hypothetical protein